MEPEDPKTPVEFDVKGARGRAIGPQTGPLIPLKIVEAATAEPSPQAVAVSRMARARSRLNHELTRNPRKSVRFALTLWAILSGRRVTGLAAEAAFWVVFSLPWLLLAMVSGIARLSKAMGEDFVHDVHQVVTEAMYRVLTPEAADQFAKPVVDDFFEAGHAGLGAIGLALALWAGSRAVMTYVEAIAIINGEFGTRGYFRLRGLSLILYAAGALVTLVALPVLIIGPPKAGALIGLGSLTVTIITVALVIAIGLVLLASLYHFSAYRRKSWLSALPGTVLALVVSGLAAFGLAVYVRRLFGTNSIYGVLATPIAIMICAFILSFIVLAGAAFNAVRDGRQVFATEPEMASPALPDSAMSDV